MDKYATIDKSIDATAKTVHILLTNVRYTIDYYQREYKWETKHIIELLDDLETKFAQDYNEDHDASMVQNYEEYFLGSIIISKRKNANYIIDGQQRLTTLTLLLIYLNNLQQDRKDKRYFDDLIFSEKYGKKNFNIEVEERMDVMKALFNNQIDSFDPNVYDQSVKNIIARYQDIEENFLDDLKGDALPSFIDWLREKVVLVEITAYSDEDAYTIFETMNDRGMELTQSDMLKGYLLSNIKGDEEKQEANNEWKKIISRLRQETEEDESEFFKVWFRSQYARSIRERKKGAIPMDFDIIGTKFHRWVRDDNKLLKLKKSEDFRRLIREDMSFYSKVYLVIANAKNSFSNKFECIYYVDCLNFTLMDPILLASISMNDDSEIIKRKMSIISRYLDIFLARRIWNWSRITYNTMSYSMFQLIKQIRNKDTNELVLILKKQLSNQEETFLYNDRFELTSKNKKHVHYLLARITHHIQTECGLVSSFEDLMNYGDAKPYEIEHIWANKFERHKNEFDHPVDFNDYRNRIGGLLLLPKGFNQSYGDKPYKEKADKYFGQNLLAQTLNEQCYKNNPEFLKYIDRCKLQFKPHTEFNKADLDDRQELYQVLCTHIWDPKMLEKELEK